MNAVIYILSKYYGLKEIIGAEYSPTILNWIKKYFPKTKDDEEVPYCSIALIEVFKELGLENKIVGTNPSAISWINMGDSVELSDAILGDIVVLKRVGGNHVGLFVRKNLKRDVIYVLGFNQSNSCSIVEFPINSLLDIRRLT